MDDAATPDRPSTLLRREIRRLLNGQINDAVRVRDLLPIVDAVISFGDPGVARALTFNMIELLEREDPKGRMRVRVADALMKIRSSGLVATVADADRRQAQGQAGGGGRE